LGQTESAEEAGHRWYTEGVTRWIELACVLVAVIASAGSALAEEATPLLLPPGEPLDAWSEAASGLGFVVCGAETEVAAGGAWVEIVVTAAGWSLRADDGAGRRREQAIEPPTGQLDREEIVLLASTLLQPAPAIAAEVAEVLGEPAPTPVEAPSKKEPVEAEAIDPFGGAGAWLGAAIRADLRAGRRQATSIALHGGVEFGPGLRIGLDLEGTTSARFDIQEEDGPIRSTWSLGAWGGLWWALRRPVVPIVGVEFGVQVRSFVADLGVERRVPVPAAAIELGASIGLGQVLRLEPQVRLVIDLAPTEVDLGTETVVFAPVAVQFGFGLRAMTGRSTKKQ
jgi:hypothetical protein